MNTDKRAKVKLNNKESKTFQTKGQVTIQSNIQVSTGEPLQSRWTETRGRAVIPVQAERPIAWLFFTFDCLCDVAQLPRKSCRTFAGCSSCCVDTGPSVLTGISLTCISFRQLTKQAHVLLRALTKGPDFISVAGTTFIARTGVTASNHVLTAGTCVGGTADTDIAVLRHLACPFVLAGGGQTGASHCLAKLTGVSRSTLALKLWRLLVDTGPIILTGPTVARQHHLILTGRTLAVRRADAGIAGVLVHAGGSRVAGLKAARGYHGVTLLTSVVGGAVAGEGGAHVLACPAVLAGLRLAGCFCYLAVGSSKAFSTNTLLHISLQHTIPIDAHIRIA